QRKQFGQLGLERSNDRTPLGILVRPQDAMRRTLHILVEFRRTAQGLRERLQRRGGLGDGHASTPKFLRRRAISASGSSSIPRSRSSSAVTSGSTSRKNRSRSARMASSASIRSSGDSSWD